MWEQERILMYCSYIENILNNVVKERVLLDDNSHTSIVMWMTQTKWEIKNSSVRD